LTKEYGDLMLFDPHLKSKFNGTQTIYMTPKCNSADPYIIPLAEINLPPGLAPYSKLNKALQTNSIQPSP
jgi:hypothetical protein